MLNQAKLTQLAKLQFFGKKFFHSSSSGLYQSILRGVGHEFLQIRDYQESDDVRFLDWKSWAKTGKLLTKETCPERDRQVLIILDCSKSMKYSSSQKLKADLALELSYAFAWISLLAQDKVGLVLFGNGQNCQFIPFNKGRKHLLHIFDIASEFMGKGKGSDLKDVLEFTSKLKLRRPLVFFISDFIFDDFEDSQKYFSIFLKKYNTVATLVSDQMEKKMVAEDYIFNTLDFERRNDLFVDSHSVNQYLEERNVNLLNFFKKNKVDLFEVLTCQDVFARMYSFFSKKK